MASQQVKINLLFDAQTAQAQKNIQSLGNLLHQISSKTTIGVDSGSLSQAVNAAQQLQTHLQNAVNVDTGKLDLMKLNQELKSSGKTLQDYASSLTAIGPTGEQAFLRLAQAVSHAEVPVVKTNKVIKDFLQTLANTAKWQIASQAVHGIEGMLNNAVGHAKDLNKALTDIQIVTNYSTNYMNNFAQAASKAAKELNTTTTEYAKASLIFYQQGLSGSAVEERASVVVKLSQVTGDSAQKVSDQMTAIWNNFDDGSKSLEYYADALTKLGAATAASTSEISNGLEKFAAVAETVGLSYEYAAASVATVVDKTRQSADVVGTSFKTIFARMQGLSLGETLEDGVDLNKYSAALEKVGVDVLNADGELRDMDQILDDLGEKWQGLGEETQIALAQTVGGVRQYNQMMALMNNWEDVHKNIDLASKSTGELATQQKIWSASYEASVEKLEQAKNELYENFIDDDLLIGFNDVLTQVLSGINQLIDRIGGIGPAAMILVGLFSKTLFPLIGNGIKQVGNTISVWSGKAAKDVAKMQDSMSEQISAQVAKGNLTEGMEQQMLLSQKILKEKQKLILNSKSMTESERAEAEAKLALAEAMAAETAQILIQKDALEKQIKKDEKTVLSDKQIAEKVVTDSFIKTRNEAPLGEHETQQRREIETQDIVSKAQSMSSVEIYQQIQKKKADMQDREQSINPLLGQQEQFNNDIENKRVPSVDPLTSDQESYLNSLQQKQKDDEAEIARLQEILKLKKEILTVDEETVRTAVIDHVKVDKAGEGSSIRLHEEDAATEEFKTQASAENAQMTNVMSGFGESVQTDDQGNMSIDASIANYEKLYEAIGKQKSLQVELAASTFDVKSVFDGLTKSSGEVTQATEEAADILKTLSKNDKQAAKAMSDRLKTVKKGSKEYKKLSNDEKKYVDALDKQAKAEAKQEKARDKSVKQLKNSKQAYLELAQKAGLTGDELTNLGKEFDSLGKDSKTNEAAIGRIKQTFGSLGAASIAVEQDLRTVASGMQQHLSDASEDGGEAIGVLTTDLEEMANQTPVVDSAMQTTQLAIDGVGNKMANMGQMITSGITTIVSMGAQLAALQTAIGGVQQAFGEGGTAAEKFQAIMGLMMTSMPLLTGMVKLFTAEKREEMRATIANIPTKLAELGIISAETAAKWALAAANIAAFMTNPWTMAIVAAGIIAGIALLAVLRSHREETENLTEANRALTESEREQAAASQEQAKEVAKTIDAWTEQMHVMDGLIAKYKELKDAQEDSADAAKDIIDAVPDMIEAYNGLAEKLDFNDQEKGQYDDLIAKLERAAEAGDVNAVEELTYQIDKMMAGKSKGSLDTGITATKSGLVSDIFTDADVKVTSTTGRNVLAGGASGIFVEDLEDDSLIKSMSDAAGLTATWTGGEKDGIKNGWTGFGIRTDTEANFVEDYEKMLKLYNDAQQKFDAAALADDEGFQALKRIIETTEGTYNDYKGMIDTRLQANIADASLGMLDPNDLNNYADYSSHRKNVYNKVKSSNPNMSEDAIQNAVNKYFAENGATSLYAKMDNRLTTLGEKGANVDEIRKYLEGATAEQQKLFLNVDINKYQTKDSIAQAIETAQAEADKEKVEVRVEGINNIIGSLKEEMSTEDWQNIASEWENIQKSFTEAGLSGLMDFQEFLSLSYKEQSEYLEKIKLQQQALLVAKAQNVLTEKQQTRDALEKDYQNSPEMDEIDRKIREKENEIRGYSKKSMELSRQISNSTQRGGFSSTTATYIDEASENNRAWNEAEAELDALQAEKAALQAEQANNLAQAEKDITAAEQELAIQMQILDDMEFEAKGLNATEVRDYADHLQEMAHKSDVVSDSLATNEQAAKNVAVAVMRMNKGVDSLSENMDDWYSILTDSDEASQEYSEALGGLREAMSDLLNVDEQYLSSGFLSNSENLDLMKEAAQGSAEAIDELSRRAARDIVLNIALDNGLDLDLTGDVLNKFDALQSYLDSQKLQIGATLDNKDFAAAAQDLINTAGMTAEQANAALGAMGYSVEFETEPQEVTEHMPITKTKREITGWDNGQPTEWTEYSYTDGSTPVTYTKQLPKMQTVTVDGKETQVPVIKSITKNSSGIMNNNSNINKGGNTGGGGSPKKLEKKKKSDTIDRYKEINDQLETSRRLMEKAQREADSLWGPARLKKMAEVTREMERQNKLLKQKATLAQRYLDEGSKNDQQDLIDIITKSVGEGVFTYDDLFDAEGNFIGYDEVTDILWKRVTDAENAVKNPEDVTEAEQQAIDDAEKVVNDVLDAVGLYDETRQTALDAIAEYEQGILNIQQAAFDELTAKMELEIEINDSDLEKLDYYLNKLSEDIWDMGERLTLMVGQLGEDGVLNLEDSQLDNYLENLDTYEAAYNDLVTQYTTINPETGKTYINQDQFIQGLKDLNSKIYSELGNLQELENTMTSAIADAYAAADETLAKYTDTMSHHISVLDHFMTLMDLLGESKNYDAMKAIAEGQVELAENMATVSKETYDMKKTALDTQIDRMKEAGFTNDEGEFDLFAISEQDMTEEQRIIREGYQAAVTAAQEAEDQMLADAATWAEALKSLLETELAELADILNKNLSGEFGSLDQLSLAMERKNSLQEEYLTTTNKIYETEKMMRTAQQEIDKTTNSVAKRRFKQFIEETEQLQNQNKLSQHELDIQQAKYDLLLAEIALEEAQNAKSTVRLQRDAEGNFGYVYTADQNKVVDAEQKLADAQNSLYNIGLEGANNYAQKYADTIAEMNDEITALSEARMNGDIASEEEYRKQKDAIIAHYYEKLNNYSHLYQASLGVDGRIIDDAWSTQFGSMTSNTEQWMQYVKDYAGQATLAFQDYFTAIEPIAQYTIGKDASDAADKTAEIVTNNQKITEEITKDGGVLDALGMQLHSVSDIVDGYLAMRETIQGAIKDAEELARVSNQTLHNESDEDPNNDLAPAQNTTPPTDPPTNPDPVPGPQPGSEEELELGSEVKVKAGTRWYADSWGGGNSGPAQDGKITIIKEENSHGYHIKGSQYGSGWVKKTDIEGFDTGGYTGAWGSYGKMAMLHEKELVLNQGDTANFLASMEVLERILQILDLQAFSSQMGGLLSSPGFRESGSQNIQQHIEINAEFPNATDRFEIEAAFKSMADLASQYTNQK